MTQLPQLSTTDHFEGYYIWEWSEVSTLLFKYRDEFVEEDIFHIKPT